MNFFRLNGAKVSSWLDKMRPTVMTLAYAAKRWAFVLNTVPKGLVTVSSVGLRSRIRVLNCIDERIFPLL